MDGLVRPSGSGLGRSGVDCLSSHPFFFHAVLVVTIIAIVVMMLVIRCFGIYISAFTKHLQRFINYYKYM